MSDDHFTAYPRRYHQQVLSSIMGRLQAGAAVVLAPEEFTAMSQLSGNLNHYAAVAPLPVIAVAEYLDGEGRRVMTFYPDQIIAVPFTVGAGPWASPHGYASSAEYGAAPGMRSASLSRTPGDMSGATQGMGVTLDFNANTMTPGQWFYNCHILPEFPPTQSGFSVAFPH